MNLTNKHNFEYLNDWVTGWWRDEIYKKDSVSGSINLVQKTNWVKNTIVDNFGVLIAGLLLGDYLLEGIQFHAVGSGETAWDTTIPPVNNTDSTLVTEELRKAPDSILYLDPYDDPLPPGQRSNIIEIRTTFAFDDGPPSGFFIREQGLFGGDATSTADTGLMLNAIRQDRTFKDSSIQIIKFIRFEIQVPTNP